MSKNNYLYDKLNEVYTVTMCGKIKYEEYMREWAALLEIGIGWNVLLPIDIYKLTGYNPRLENSSMDIVRKVHRSKIMKSDAILVYVDKNYEFCYSDNVIGEIADAIVFKKDIYFTQGINASIMRKISTALIDSVKDKSGKDFKIKYYKYIDVYRYRFYQLHYEFIKEE